MPNTGQLTQPTTVHPRGAAEPVRELLSTFSGGRETWAEFRRTFPKAPVPDAESLIDELRRVDLRGRGGAGFPVWIKLDAVVRRSAQGPVVVVANGEEGEPASVKDRFLLRHRPHMVLEGLRIVQAVLGEVHSTTVYVSDPIAGQSVRRALSERSNLHADVFLTESRYVSGEETAAVRAINGGPALPVQKPPRPFEEGVLGLPTAVMNVETLARVAQLCAAVGDADSAADRSLLTLVGPEGAVLTEATRHERLVDVAREVLGIEVVEGTPVLAGGFFSGFLPSAALAVGLGFEEFRGAGTGLGCGAFVCMPTGCPVEMAVDVLAFYDRENAHQCGSCFKGTAAMHQALSRISVAHARDEDSENLRRWSTSLVGRGSCGALDGAAGVVRTLLDQFGPAVETHATEACPGCAAAAANPRGDTQFRVALPNHSHDQSTNAKEGP